MRRRKWNELIVASSKHLGYLVFVFDSKQIKEYKKIGATILTEKKCTTS